MRTRSLQRDHRAITLTITVMALATGYAHAQSYLVKPLRIVTASVGGGNDALSRLIAGGIATPLGQQVIVENRAATVTASMVAKAPADGYTLLVGTSSVWLSQYVQKVTYDAVKDLAPVTLAATATNVLVVHPSMPVKSVKMLVALAKARPGELNYSTGATGSTTHLAGELFRYSTGVNIVRIPYKDTAMETTDQLSGQVHMTFGAAAQVKQHIQAGKLRSLAVTSAQPSALFPGLPTMAASGVPGYEIGTNYGVWMPAAVPPAIIARVNQEITRLLKSSEIRDRVLGLGMDAIGSTAEEFDAFVKADMTRLGKVIREAGIRAD